MNLEEKIKELQPYELDCDVFSVYNYRGLTMNELLNQFFTRINECIKLCNGTIDLAKWLVNEGLSIEVANKLNEWLIDGTLAQIINEVLLKEIETKITQIETDIDTIERDVAKNKQDIESINTELLEHDDRIISNQNNIVDLDNKVDSFDTRINQNTSDISDIKSKLLPFNLYDNNHEPLYEKIDDYLEDLEFNDSYDRIRIGTLNTVGTRYENLNATTKIAHYILDRKIAVAGCQEFVYYPDFDNEYFIRTKHAIENIFAKVNFIHVDGGRRCNALVSGKFQCNNGGEWIINPGYETRSFIWGHINVNNKNLRVYTIHCTHDNQTLMREQIAKLAQHISSSPTKYVIVTGDFNTNSPYDFQPLTNLGFKFSFDISEGHIDNILYSSSIRNIDTHIDRVDSDMSDHRFYYGNYELV